MLFNHQIFNHISTKWHCKHHYLSEHFLSAADGLKIISVTPTGRTTCNRLDLNNERYNEASIIKARRFWVKRG